MWDPQFLLSEMFMEESQEFSRAMAEAQQVGRESGDSFPPPDTADGAEEDGAVPLHPDSRLAGALRHLATFNVSLELARLSGPDVGGLDSARSSNSSGSSAASSPYATPRNIPRPAGPSPRAAAAAAAAAAEAKNGGEAKSGEVKKASPRPKPPGLPPSRSNSAKAKAEAKDGGDDAAGRADEKK